MKKVNLLNSFITMSKYITTVLAVVLMFQVTLISAEAETVGSYDADAAVAYAKAHYDDDSTEVGNKPDCIQFVRQCFEAGGVEKDENRVNSSGEPYGYTVEDYVSYAVNNGYAELYKLTTEKQDWDTPQWYVRAEDNADILTIGDGIIYKCTDCGKVFHASIHTGVNDSGFAEYHAQNSAVAGKPLCKIDCFSCDDNRENVDLYVLHITSEENGYDDHYNDAVVTGLNAVTDSNENIEITWDALEGASGYKVFKKNGKSSVYNLIGDTVETSFVYEEQPDADKSFYFAVRPYKEENGKTYVGKMCDTFTYKQTVTGQLEAPTITGFYDAENGKAQLTWDAVTGASEYDVYRATSKSGSYTHLKTVSTASFKNSSVTYGKTYYYKVVAVSSNSSTEDSKDSNILKIKCALESPTISVSNVASSGKNEVSWDAVAGAGKYEVYRATSSSGSYTKLTTTSKTSYTDSKAVAGKKYYYKVKALLSGDSTVKSSYSDVVSRVCDLAKPTVTASNVDSSGKIKISWDKVTGADKYEVYRATSADGTYKKMITTSKTSYTNTGAIAGKKYYYKVKAVLSTNSSATSAYSSSVSRVCDLAKPTVSITGVSSTGKNKVTWKAVDGADKYEVYRATSEKGTFKKVITTTKTSYTHTGATSGKKYYYKVKAVLSSSSSATSAYSNTVSRVSE